MKTRWTSTWLALLLFLGTGLAHAESEREQRGYLLLRCSALMTIVSAKEGYTSEAAGVSAMRFWDLGQGALTLERGSVSNGQIMDLRESTFAEYQSAYQRGKITSIHSDLRQCMLWDQKILQLLAASGARLGDEISSGDAVRQRRVFDRLTEPPTPEELAARTYTINTDFADRLAEESFAVWAEMEFITPGKVQDELRRQVMENLREQPKQ